MSLRNINWSTFIALNKSVFIFYLHQTEENDVSFYIKGVRVVHFCWRHHTIVLHLNQLTNVQVRCEGRHSTSKVSAAEISVETHNNIYWRCLQKGIFYSFIILFQTPPPLGFSYPSLSRVKLNGSTKTRSVGWSV